MEFIRTKVALFTLAEKFLRRVKRIYYPPFRKKGMTLTKYGQELRLPSICLLPTAKQGRFFQHLAGNVLQVGRNVQQLTAFLEKLRQHAGGAALYFCAILVHCLIRHKNTYKFLILRLKQDGFGSLAGFCSVIWPDFVREFGQISFSRLAGFRSVVWSHPVGGQVPHNERAPRRRNPTRRPRRVSGSTDLHCHVAYAGRYADDFDVVVAVVYGIGLHLGSFGEVHPFQAGTPLYGISGNALRALAEYDLLQPTVGSGLSCTRRVPCGT